MYEPLGDDSARSSGFRIPAYLVTNDKRFGLAVILYKDGACCRKRISGSARNQRASQDGNRKMKLPSLEDLANALKGPVDLFTGDGQRRCNANHSIMRFFREQAFFLQSFAIRARGTAHLDANP